MSRNPNPLHRKEWFDNGAGATRRDRPANRFDILSEVAA